MIGQGQRRAAPPAPKISFVPVTGWAKGRNSKLDIDRIAPDMLRVTENVQLDQNGTVTPRPGLKPYGSYQPTGTVLGQVFEYTRMNGTTSEAWNIWAENRSGVGTILTNKDGGTPLVISGKTYSVTGNFHYEQVFGQVLIMNGVDNLSYMNVQTQAITPMAALTTASINSVTPTSNLTSSPAGFLQIRYRVTAANQGETAASTAVIATVNKDRSNFNGTTEYNTIVINRVTGASRYNVYVGTQVGNEFYLDTIEDPGSGSTVTYIDYGTVAETATRTAPVGDSTAGPKVTRATNVKGQIYMVGDTDNPGRIWFGGTGNNVIDFSSYNGGGWVEPNKGGKDLPVRIIPFRDGKGTPMAACLSKGTNGTGKRYLLQPSTTTLGDTIITYMAVTEDNGTDGTDSPDAVALIDDAAIYPSRTGFKSSTTKPSIQNIISTSGVSDNIAPDVANLIPSAMGNAVVMVNDRHLWFALPNASTKNNQIWDLDLSQKGAWVSPMYVSADWLWLYSENSSGVTRKLALVNNQFVEFDKGTQTNDNGTAFSTNISTGGLKFNEDGSTWGSVIDVTFVVERPQGNINLSVDAYTEDGIMTFSDTIPGSTNQAVSAWGAYGWSQSGWGEMVPYSVPTGITKTTPRKTWTIPVDEECNMVVCSLGTLDSGVSYQLAEIIVRYVAVGYKEVDN